MSEKTRAPRGSLTPEEARLRKNERQREYAKRTGYAANKRYAESNPAKSVTIGFRLQHPKDDDVIERIQSIENKSDYLRRLVRMDINKNSDK